MTLLLNLTHTTRKGEQLNEKVEAQLADIRRTPHLVRSFFRAPDVAYITDCWPTVFKESSIMKRAFIVSVALASLGAAGDVLTAI